MQHALMKNAGIMGSPNIEGKDFDQQIAQLGAAVSYGCNDSYFYISISGEDENMNKIMNLVNRQLLMPYLEQKQLDAVKGNEFFSRYSRQKRTAVQKSALMQYALYGKKSSYLDEVPFIGHLELDGVKVQSLIASGSYLRAGCVLLRYSASGPTGGKPAADRRYETVQLAVRPGPREI